jgi:hypothetical protein
MALSAASALIQIALEAVVGRHLKLVVVSTLIPSSQLRFGKWDLGL